MAGITAAQAREKWEAAGEEWSPAVEAALRDRGIIEQPAAPPPAGLPWWQELGAGLGSMIAGPTSGLGGQLDAAQRIATGTTVGEQTTAGALGGLTAGQMSPERLGIPAPASVVQRGANLFGQGAGMAAAFTPIVKGAGMAAAGVANPLLRASATGALSFGAYNAAAPADGFGERLQNVGEGALTGAVLGPLPMLPGVRNVAALPGGRTAVDLAAFTGLGVVHGQDPATAFVEALPQLAAMKLVHGAAEKPRNPGRPTPEQVAAEIEALEARLTNERAPVQAEVLARVAPFREAQASAQGLQTPATPAEYNRLAGPEVLPPRGNTPEVDAAARERAQAIQAETLARERAEYEAKKAFEADFRQRMEAERQRRLAEEAAVPPRERPLQPEIKWSPNPDQYSRTQARIEAMRARQAAAQQPAPEQPLTRTPAQMEIPLETAPAIPLEAAPAMPLEPAPVTAAEAPPVKETRGQRRARLQAEASQVNAEAARRMGTDLTLGMGGGQQVFEAVGRALKDVAIEVKDAPRRARNIGAAAKTDWEAARAELVKKVAENPASGPFTDANQGKITYEQAVDQVVSMPRRVKKLTDLRQYPESATEGVRDIIDTDNLAALRADISKPLADRLDRAPESDLPEKQRGFTDPVRKTQEVSDGELVSAVEMSEIHGGREIEMATYKQAANYGEQYRDLKARTGVTGDQQLKIAGQLMENYVSRNRGHVGGDLEFVRDPVNRQLLIDSGNPSGMLEYVKGVRAIMDSAGNLYNKTNKGLGGEGLGDIAAYFPKVAVKPRFFQIGERLARAKARKGADPRTRNTAEEVFNPRSERRSSTDPNKVEIDGREVAREWNAETVLEGYLDTMLRGVSGDIALSQSMKAAKYDDILADRAERAGNQQEADNRRARANVIRTLAQQKWNHQLFGVGARAEDVFKAFGAPGSMALEAVAANKRAFDNTKYRLNPRFNLVTQWTSILNPSMADPVAAMLALRDMGVPGLPTEAKKFAESTYEVRRKAMPHSQMRAQVEGTGSIGETLSAPTTPGKKIVRTAEKVFVDGLTQGIENWANKYSALIGYHSTRNLKGLTPRQRALAAGETVFKTQSAFTFGERAGVLNSRAVQGLAPAQGYAVELANQIREALGATGVDTKLYGETSGQQARRAGAIVAAAVMQNIWQNVIFNAMRGKDPEESLNFDSVWDATVALPPFISLLLPTGKGGRDMPNPVLPIAQGNMLLNKGGKVASKIVQGEDATGAAVDLLRYGAGNWGGPGGAFTSDLMGGRYDFLMGEDEGADAPNTAKARPVSPSKATARRATARR